MTFKTPHQIEEERNAKKDIPAEKVEVARDKIQKLLDKHPKTGTEISYWMTWLTPQIMEILTPELQDAGWVVGKYSFPDDSGVTIRPR